MLRRALVAAGDGAEEDKAINKSGQRAAKRPVTIVPHECAMIEIRSVAVTPADQPCSLFQLPARIFSAAQRFVAIRPAHTSPDTGPNDRSQEIEAPDMKARGTKLIAPRVAIEAMCDR